MKKFVLGVAVAGVLGVAATGSASAGPPAVRGCLGESVAQNAHALWPYGRFISSVAPANDFGTMGDAVQQVQSGAVPDEIYWNTCNDG